MAHTIVYKESKFTVCPLCQLRFSICVWSHDSILEFFKVIMMLDFIPCKDTSWKQVTGGSSGRRVASTLLVFYVFL